MGTILRESTIWPAQRPGAKGSRRAARKISAVFRHPNSARPDTYRYVVDITRVLPARARSTEPFLANSRLTDDPAKSQVTVPNSTFCPD